MISDSNLVQSCNINIGRLIITLAAVFILCGAVVPQNMVVRERTTGQIVSYEVHTIKKEQSYFVLIPFRIRYDFFVFTRPTTHPSGNFTAQGEISIELIDSTETSVARSIEQFDLSVPNNSAATLKSQYAQNFFEFDLPPGTYTVVVKLEDKESQRVYTDRKKKVSVERSASLLSGLIPIHNSGNPPFQLINFDGNVLFSHDYGFAFVSAREHDRAIYSLIKLQSEDAEKETIIDKDSVSVHSIGRSTLKAAAVDSQIILSVIDHPGTIVSYVRFDGTLLRQGRYELTLTFHDSTVLRTTFAAIWPDMPLSLTDLSAATEPLQFITTKDEYSQLTSGNRSSRIKKFEEFWKQRDATKETAYNEVMHEFYRRVDYAQTAFQTLRGSNGSGTDRGKIYILYGKPTSIDRILNTDGAPKEVWTYASLNKVFTFEDPSKQGNYKLTER